VVHQAQRLNQKSPYHDIEAIYTLLNENETKKADGDLIYLDNKLKEIRKKYKTDCNLATLELCNC
jgi:hypothetical protein